MVKDPSPSMHALDFSPLADTSKKMQVIMLPIIQTAFKFQEVMQPIADSIARLQLAVNEFARGFAKAARPLYVAEILGDVQFIYWNYIEKDFADMIIATDNVNQSLQGLFDKENYSSVDNTVAVCENNILLCRHLRLFKQSITAFKNGQHDLAVIGLTSIIDGLLTDVSGDSATNIKARVEVIMEKLEKNEAADSDEYALLALAITFQRTIDSFSAFSNFAEEEPPGLNRHWIMHGRSCRRKTALDCIKLINLIYGIMLIDGFGKMSQSS